MKIKKAIQFADGLFLFKCKLEICKSSTHLGVVGEGWLMPFP